MTRLKAHLERVDGKPEGADKQVHREESIGPGRVGQELVLVKSKMEHTKV